MAAISFNHPVTRVDEERGHFFGHEHGFGHHHSTHIISRPFAGRIGGNQQFAINHLHPDRSSILHRTPDAAPYLSWSDSFRLTPLLHLELWKQAFYEGWAMCMFTFLSGLTTLAVAPLGEATSLGGFVPTLIGVTETIISLALFIYVAGPVSGGHVNPLITIGTFCARLATFPRTVLYVSFQQVGATIGGFLVRAAIDNGPLPAKALAGCYLDPQLTTPATAYVIETLSALSLVYLAFGVGLDPRQRLVVSPSLAPILVGFVVGLVLFCSAFVKKGYMGACVNPARCFGLMAASGSWNYHYIHWTGDITGAVINGFFCWLMPPGSNARVDDMTLSPAVEADESK